MTYFIGLDIAKYKHDCFIMNENEEVIKDSFSFSNDMIGFNTLLNVLNSLDPDQEKKIGLEATGHYGSNLKIFLEENNYSYMEINPILIKQFLKATTLRRTKTDKKDASLIALYISTMTYKPYLNSSYHLQCLKSLCRMRWSLVEERTRYLVYIINVLDKIFPEFKPFFNNNLKSATAMYLLENYTTASKISRMNIESYNKMKSELRRTLSYARFQELKQLAKDTIGKEDTILTYQLKTYLELFKELGSKIEDIESSIKEEYLGLHCHIHTIPGIGIVSAATILSEIGNIERFNTVNQLLSFAGLEPSITESGTMSFKGKMVKHGSSNLRRVLMNSAEMSLIHNPKFYDYYLKKKDEGKHHRVCLSHIAKKLIRIIFYLEKNDCDYDQQKVR